MLTPPRMPRANWRHLSKDSSRGTGLLVSSPPRVRADEAVRELCPAPGSLWRPPYDSLWGRTEVSGPFFARQRFSPRGTSGTLSHLAKNQELASGKRMRKISLLFWRTRKISYDRDLRFGEVQHPNDLSHFIPYYLMFSLVLRQHEWGRGRESRRGRI